MKTVVAEAVALDLENNLAVKVQIARSIVGKDGNRFNQDMILVTSNAAMAIAYRNAALKVIPEHITDRLYKAAEDTIVGNISTPDKKIAMIRNTVDEIMKRYAISEKEVLFAIAKESVDHVTKEDIISLKAIDKAIERGEQKVDYVFKGKEERQEEKKAPREERLIEFMRKCSTYEQLMVFKPKVKTNAEREVFDEMKTQLKPKEDGQ